MKIEKIELSNFRSASRINFEFAEGLNLFVGINGSGKSTVLDALGICLSWLVRRIERENGRGSYIPDSSLHIDQDRGFLDLHVTEGGNSYSWLIAKTARGHSSDLASQFDGTNRLSEAIKANNARDMVWPVIAYYPVNRIVGVIRPEIPDRDSIYDLDVYQNAIGGKANYQSFFEWFRLQDDILNEKALSRSKWVRQNQNWIKRRVSRLFDLLKEAVPYDETHFDREEFKHFIDRFEKDEMIYEEPRFLFRELSHLLEMLGTRGHLGYEAILHDLEYMFHKMSSLSSEHRDDLIEEGGHHEEMVERIVQSFDQIWCEEEQNEEMIAFLWESFSFATLLSLWWLSDSGKRDLEREFRALSKSIGLNRGKSPGSMTTPLLPSLRQVINREVHQKRNAYRNEAQELQTVTEAIEKFIPEYKHLRVKRVPRAHMLIDKGGVSFNLDQLSDGEKSLVALVGDIARRLAIGNPQRNNPLEGEGVILIDEIDLHLHPSWQRLVIPKLLEVFPNCQFFISTHSPQVISHAKPESVFLLEQTEEGLTYRKVDETYGMSLNRIVELVMDDESRPAVVHDELNRIFELIERGKIAEAKKLISSLREDMQTDPDLMRFETLIRREEMNETHR